MLPGLLKPSGFAQKSSEMCISGYRWGYGSPRWCSRARSRLPRSSPTPICSRSTRFGLRLRLLGFYAWWCQSAAVPGDALAPTHPAGLGYSLLYLGIAPNSVRSKRNLRSRLRQHTGANLGGSTFRLSLAALLSEREGWTPIWTDRPCLEQSDLDALLAWQRTNLRARWCKVAEPWRPGLESEVIRLMTPPLNRDHNEAHPFYGTIGDARSALREAARSRPARR